MASRVRKVFGTFENEPLLVRGHITSLGYIALPTTDRTCKNVLQILQIYNLTRLTTDNLQKGLLSTTDLLPYIFFKFLMFFSLFVDCGLLDVNEIDPIGRHLCNSANFHYGFSNCRYSSFKVNTILRLESRVP